MPPKPVSTSLGQGKGYGGGSKGGSGTSGKGGKGGCGGGRH